jgi:hypothetical protein
MTKRRNDINELANSQRGGNVEQLEGDLEVKERERRVKEVFDTLKSEMMTKYSGYNEKIHDLMLQEMAETMVQIEIYNKLIRENREGGPGVFYALRDARRHYETMLDKLVMTFTSMAKTPVVKNIDEDKFQSLIAQNQRLIGKIGKLKTAITDYLDGKITKDELREVVDSE